MMERGESFFTSVKIDQIGADIFGTEPLRGLTEMSGKAGDLQQIAGLRIRGQVAKVHFLDHALA
jgi:hypothetical protein